MLDGASRRGPMAKIVGSFQVQVLKDGRFKAPEELARVFEGAGVDPGKPIVASCGTGVTASVLALALHQLSPASQVNNEKLCVSCKTVDFTDKFVEGCAPNTTHEAH